MDPFSALSLCGEVAIAITGFSGVVLVFGEGRGVAPKKDDNVLLQTLFTGSLVPLFLIAVAFVVNSASLDLSTTWRASSAAHVVTLVVILIMRGRGGSLVVPAPGGRLILAGSPIVLLLSVANIVSLHAFWPFLAVVWWGIIVSLWAFVALIFASRAA